MDAGPWKDGQGRPVGGRDSVTLKWRSTGGNQARQRNKRHRSGKRRSETITVADVIVFYEENHKDSLKQLLEFIRNLVTLQEAKPTERNLWCFYTVAEKRNLRKPIYSSNKEKKRLGNKFNWGGESCILKTMKHGLKKLRKRWIHGKCSWIIWPDSGKTSTPPKAICRFNAKTIKIPMALFTEMETPILGWVVPTKKERYGSIFYVEP